MRSFGSKCFAGGFAQLRGSSFKAGGLLEPESLPALAARSREVPPAPSLIVCSKPPEGEQFSSCLPGTLADNPPALFDAKQGQMGQPTMCNFLKTAPLCDLSFVDIPTSFGQFALAEPAALRGESG